MTKGQLGINVLFYISLSSSNPPFTSTTDGVFIHSDQTQRTVVYEYCTSHYCTNTVQLTTVQILYSSLLYKYCSAHYCTNTVRLTAVRYCTANCPVR